jgi:hypothetical protein
MAHGKYVLTYIAGDKARQQTADMGSAIKQDLSFFSDLLGLSAEQKVKLGLYLEFATGGNLARLKEM